MRNLYGSLSVTKNLELKYLRKIQLEFFVTESISYARRFCGSQDVSELNID